MDNTSAARREAWREVDSSLGCPLSYGADASVQGTRAVVECVGEHPVPEPESDRKRDDEGSKRQDS